MWVHTRRVAPHLLEERRMTIHDVSVAIEAPLDQRTQARRTALRTGMRRHASADLTLLVVRHREVAHVRR
eukprot:7390727-Prymnesium_polylepis.1